MPITSSAKKALRNSVRKRVFNVRRKRSVDEAMKELKSLLKAGKAEEVKKAFSNLQKALDKAAKAHTISKNTASRKKSRIAGILRKAKMVS